METHVTRKLRKAMTPWERKLWSVLRNRQLKGSKFRRQFKIGSFVVDFCCLQAKLVIELDGGHHFNPENLIEDAKRQKYIESVGYKVLRFQNLDIEINLDGVVLRIIESL